MTSTMTSSGVRQTPALTVPSTQNTAPVLEYRCLYTHDLRRKQKRWQDGLLRFHTFNKRIMVYDVSRNYIGDMHWREDEILQDGDEFELDRGVLIQVGETTGSMEQDLTGLFEKRKKAPEVAVNGDVQHQPIAVPMARGTAAQPSQLRPKTLNALLGTPKGRIGRAALPTKSPHELRMESENDNWDRDRPAKRQRIESRLERRTEPDKMPPPRIRENPRGLDERVNRTARRAVVYKQSEEEYVPTVVLNDRLSLAENAVDRPLTASISNCRNEEAEISTRVVEPLPKKRSAGRGSSEVTAQQRKREPDTDARVFPKSEKIAKRLDHEPDTGNARTSTIIKPIEIASDEDGTSTDQQPKQRLRLRIASRKPRKKLMYRDLLPQEPSAIGGSYSDAPVQDQSSRDRSTSGRPEKRTKHSMAEFHKKEQERLKLRLHRHRAKEMDGENERKKLCGDAPEDLFLSQEDIDTISANVRRIVKGPKEKASNPSMIGSSRRNTEPIFSSIRGSSSLEAPREVIPRPPSTVHSTAMTLAKMDETLFLRAQSMSPELVEDNAEVLPPESFPHPIPKTPPDVVYTTSSSKDRPGSSPAFQTQAHIPSSKDIPQEAIHTLSRPNPDSLSAFTRAVQPKVQQPKRHISDISPLDPHLPSSPPKAVNTVSAPSPQTDHAVSALNSQSQPDVHPTSFQNTEQPVSDIVPQMPKTKLNSLLLAPKPPAAPEPALSDKSRAQPASTNVVPTTTTPNFPHSTLEILSSQRPSLPPPPPPPAESPIIPPHPQKRKPVSLSLPAFTKVVPTKPRSPLRKSISDTSAMRPPSALPVSDGKEKVVSDDTGANDESAGLWSKEAWDLFGCGRDGVECTYEEFKRKEGLV